MVNPVFKGICFGLIAITIIATATVYAQVQNVTAAMSLSWTQRGLTLAELADTLNTRFRAKVDGNATGVVLSGVTCSGTTTITCKVPNTFATAPGTHSVTLNAEILVGGTWLPSVDSTVCNFRVVTAPPAPENLIFVP